MSSWNIFKQPIRILYFDHLGMARNWVSQKWMGKASGFREVVFGHDHLHRPSSLYPWQKGVFHGKMLILLSLSSQKRRFPTVGKSANYRHYRWINIIAFCSMRHLNFSLPINATVRGHGSTRNGEHLWTVLPRDSKFLELPSFSNALQQGISCCIDWWLGRPFDIPQAF